MCSFLLWKNVYIYKETGVLGETNLDIKILQVCYDINNDDYFKKKTYFLNIRVNVIPKKMSEVCGLSGSIARPPLPLPRFAHELLNQLTIIRLFIMSKLFYFWPSVAK